MKAGQNTLFQVGLLGLNTLQTEDLSVLKELEEAVEMPFSSVSSVGAKISMIPLKMEVRLEKSYILIVLKV